MINTICKALTGKEILIFNFHRNSKPLVNRETKKKYFFLTPIPIWKATAVFGRRSKLRYRVMAGILSFIDPVSIIDINWTDKRHSLYFAWCRRKEKKFIVIQHGIYYAGRMEDIREKYVKCTTHLVWGKHFKQMREQDNQGKKCDFITYGNPVYNQYNRSRFTYKKQPGNNILIAVSVIKKERLKKLYAFLKKLETNGFAVTLKEHNHQSTKGEPIEGYRKTGENLYDLLKEQRYDYYVTDVSSAMTDIIFFKNRAIYFSPKGDEQYHTDNEYEKFLVNIALRDGFFSDGPDLLNQLSVSSQEALLNYLIRTDGVSNTLDHILNK